MRSVATKSRDVINTRICYRFVLQEHITGELLARASHLHYQTGHNRTRREMQQARVDPALSRNISQLLENLLQNYESSHLPTHGQGTQSRAENGILT
jgi:hypothetical protein